MEDIDRDCKERWKNLKKILHYKSEEICDRSLFNVQMGCLKVKKLEKTKRKRCEDFATALNQILKTNTTTFCNWDK